VADQMGQVDELLPTGISIVYQYQGLMFVYPGIAKSFAFKTTLFNQPSRGDLVFLFRYFIKGGRWISIDKFIEFFPVYDWILKKTSTIAQFLRVGQLTLSYGNNGIGNIPEVRVYNTLKL